MLTARPGGGFIAGPLDILIVLRHERSGRFHTCVVTDVTPEVLEGAAKTRLQMQYRMHHTVGAADPAELDKLIQKMRADITFTDQNVCTTPLVWDGEKFTVMLPNWRDLSWPNGLEAALATKFRRWKDDVATIEQIRSADRYDALVEITGGSLSPLSAASYILSKGCRTAEEFFACRERLHLMFDQLITDHITASGRPISREILADANGWGLIIGDLKCDGCDNNGIRHGATPHAGTPPDGYVVVERCDTCCRFGSDLTAAQAWGEDAREQKGNGTTQTIARPRVAATPARA